MAAPAGEQRKTGEGRSNEVSFHELLDAVVAAELAQRQRGGQAAVIRRRELNVVDGQRRAADLPDAEVVERLRGVEGERLLVRGRGRIGKGEDQRARGVVLDVAG